MEVWKDIEGFEGLYAVSTYGNGKSLERVVMRSNSVPQTVRERVLKPLNKCVRGNNYLQFILSKDGVSYPFSIHQLVAQTFIKNPDPTRYTVVHHIDHDQTNNRVDNLVWMTKEDHDALHTEGKSKTVYQYTLDGKLVKIWSSASEVEKVLGYSQAGICRCCNGGFYRKGKWINIKSANGYIWSYKPL